MDLNVLCIFASILIVSAGAARFDLGPQRFYETSPARHQSSLAPRRDQNAIAKDVVLYLTPSQIKALEASGAVVRPADDNDTEEAPEEAQQENEDQPENAEQEPEQEQEQEQEENENENEAEQPEQQEEPEQTEQNQEADDDFQAQDFDLEEIFRILDEEQLEQEEENVEPARNEPQVTEEPEENNADEERQIPLRFQIRQNQQQKQQLPQQQRQQKYVAPSSDQNSRSKVYAAIRYQRNEQARRARVQLARQVLDSKPAQEPQEQAQTEAPQGKRYRLVPYEVIEQPEENAPEQQPAQDEQQPQQEQEQQEEAQLPVEEQRSEQEIEERLNALLTPILSPERLAEFISQRKNKLSKNEQELQAILNELKQSTKYNDQKYAIEIEKLRSNLQKQNTLAKAEAIAKAAPQFIRKEVQRKPSQSAKLVKAVTVARKPEVKRPKASRPQPVPVEVKPVPVPVVRTQKAEVVRPVPVAAREKRIPVPVTRNVYVKVNKPYLVDRTVPVEIKKQIPVEIPIRKPQKVTILRHVWEH